MGWWQVNADTLAGSRFVVSPMAEVFASLKLLHAGAGSMPGEREWLARHLPGYRARLAADPVTALLVRAGVGRKWIADFLTPTPVEGASFEAEVARVRDTDPAEARRHLTLSLPGPVPERLCRDDLPQLAARLLEFVWEEAVHPYWERRRRILEADVVARTARISRGGWAAALDTLRPGTRWLGGDRLQVNLHEHPPREISGAELLFVPVTPKAGWVSWEDGKRYAVVYPCAGVLADAGRAGASTVVGGAPSTPGIPGMPGSPAMPDEPGVLKVPDGLGALLGRGRARVLVLLDSPLSTTQLVALTGQGLGSVGRHLKVLLDAGLVRRRRAGRSVLYYRAPAGDVLVAAPEATAHRTGTRTRRS
ncbi:ArsR/SmtB family transcription factor [Streptomyces poonensis]|uniref:ArsR/SmtB family transcription factor n=1 Tax=Streptomyces poonensis TaxID=68255 RepID=UPI0016745937|nr:ArsR family transcriptional regulator [Streptomyces poonensis]